MWESIILNKLIEQPLIAYGILFAGMTVEGEIVLLSGIFAAELGFLDLRLVLFVALLGMWIGDIAWYYLGSYIEPYLPHRKIMNVMSFLDKAISDRPTLSLLLSKFIYFVNRFILIRIRQLKVPFGKFFKADLIAGIIWFFTVALLGIIFSASFSLLKHYVRVAEVGLLALLIMTVVGEHYLGNYLRRKIQKF